MTDDSNTSGTSIGGETRREMELATGRAWKQKRSMGLCSNGSRPQQMKHALLPGSSAQQGSAGKAGRQSRAGRPHLCQQEEGAGVLPEVTQLKHSLQQPNTKAQKAQPSSRTQREGGLWQRSCRLVTRVSSASCMQTARARQAGVAFYVAALAACSPCLWVGEVILLQLVVQARSRGSEVGNACRVGA